MKDKTPAEIAEIRKRRERRRTYKGLGPSTTGPAPDDEDADVDLPAVDLAAVKAVSASVEMSRAEVSDEKVPEVLVGAEPPVLDGLASSGAASGAGRPRTVIIAVPQVPSGDNARRLRSALAKMPGPNTVILPAALLRAARGAPGPGRRAAARLVGIVPR